jgi:phosphoribosylglycinamide formyltransferase 1
MPDRCIVLLAADGPSTRAVYHALRDRFAPTCRIEVILEERVSRLVLLARRVKRLGYRQVVGQLLFMLLVVPVVRRRSRARVAEIAAQCNLQLGDIPEPVHRVGSANDEDARRLLHTLAPDVIVVNGTRILGAATLGAVAAPFINMHAGVTPGYRGVHGAWWALAEGRAELVGTTLHIVDQGIDTGSILEQVFFNPTERDNFSTYPYLNTAAGCPALMRAVAAALEGRLVPLPPSGMESRLRYHPTIWRYVHAGLTRKVW